MRTQTKKPMLLSTVRLPARDAEIWLTASALEGTSRSEFLRMATRERARRILAAGARDKALPNQGIH